MTVLDRRTLNRTLLARQHLLARVDMPVAAMVEHLVGLQAQVPRDPYISLWSRLRAFDPAELERLLLDRQAVRMTLMRTTLHLITARDAVRLRSVMQGVCERGFRSTAVARRLEGVDLAPIVAAGAAILGERPRTMADLRRELGAGWPDLDPEAVAFAVRYLVPVVQVPPRGLLSSTAAARMTTLAQWLSVDWPPADPPADPPAVDPVVLRYLRAFGPASTSDIRTWSWLTDARASIDRLRPRLRVYRNESGRELFDVEDGVIASPDEPAPVRFTGEYDNLFLAHADRTRITGDSAWGAGYARRGAFFVDGFLAGAWRLVEERRRQYLALDARRPLSAGDRSAVEDEAGALAAFLALGQTSPELRWTGTTGDDPTNSSGGTADTGSGREPAA